MLFQKDFVTMPYQMRNSTRLIFILKDCDLNVSGDKKELQVIMVHKEFHTSCIVYGKNLSDVLSKCVRYSGLDTKDNREETYTSWNTQIGW